MNKVRLSEVGVAECEVGTGPSGDGEGSGPEMGKQDEAWLRQVLHDLCQPVMALDCLLSVNREPVAGESLDAALLRLVMEEGLVECGRMMALVRAMQQHMAEKAEVQRPEERKDADRLGMEPQG